MREWNPVSKWAYWAVVRAHKAGGNTTRRQRLKYNTYAQNVTEMNNGAAIHRMCRKPGCRCEAQCITERSHVR
jgi:hypothetical protein